MTTAGRGRPRELPLAAVLAGVAAGLVLVWGHHYRLGSVLVGLTLLGGAGLRLLLPLRAVGLLAVRSRPFDVAALAGMGAAVVTLAALVPPPT